MFLVGAHQFSYVPSRILPKESFLDDNQQQRAKCACFSDFITMRTRKARVNQVALFFGPLFRCERTLTRITSGLHVHVSTCNFMSKDRSGCSADTVKPGRKPLRILCHVLSAHKSWPGLFGKTVFFQGPRLSFNNVE